MQSWDDSKKVISRNSLKIWIEIQLVFFGAFYFPIVFKIIIIQIRFIT